MIVPGLVSVTFRQLSQRDIVTLAREVGLQAIEWGGDIHVPHGNRVAAGDARRMTAEAGLRVAAYGSYYRAAESEEDGLDFKTVLETAVELGAPTIRVWAGAIGSVSANEAHWERVVDDSRRIAELAAAEHISVSYEYHADTLTDTNESAQRLLREVNHPNLFTFWQPPNEKDLSYCLDGLCAILPKLTNVHVFHWWPTAGNRCPLAEGRQRWEPFLRIIDLVAGEHFALLEFVRDDNPDWFRRDAQTLKTWLSRKKERAFL